MIKLQCPCGHLLNLPESLAGKQVRCKRCNKVLKVRGGSVADGQALTESQRLRVEQEFVVQGSRPCPGCGKMHPPAIVVCVACGLNIDSGAMLYASLDEQQAAAGGAPEDRRAPPGSLWQRVLRSLGLGRK
ncbi:MAG: hypothetical protein KF878_25390 [Planctomycetes bacterium]|nr:hypothetical protein [Planctomycetota bacterium]MCW8142090.1 hypothetical protein [Planctomycetota bacterium]